MSNRKNGSVEVKKLKRCELTDEQWDKIILKTRTADLITYKCFSKWLKVSLKKF